MSAPRGMHHGLARWLATGGLCPLLWGDGAPGGTVDIFKRGSVEHNLQSIYYYDIGAEVSGSHDVPGRRQGVGRSGGWQWAGPAPGPRRARRAPFPEARERRESGRGTRDETPAAPAAPPPRCRAPRTARVKNLRGGSSLRPCLAGHGGYTCGPLSAGIPMRVRAIGSPCSWTVLLASLYLSRPIFPAVARLVSFSVPAINQALSMMCPSATGHCHISNRQNVSPVRHAALDPSHHRGVHGPCRESTHSALALAEPQDDAVQPAIAVG